MTGANITNKKIKVRNLVTKEILPNPFILFISQKNDKK
jgi:hypothetical protein